MKNNILPYISIFTTILCTVYGQLITKWRVNVLGVKSQSLLSYYKILFFDPLFISGLCAVIPAGLCWIYAIKHIPLNIAYPFIGLTFALVMVGSAILLREALTVNIIVGTACIVAGIIIIALR